MKQRTKKIIGIFLYIIGGVYLINAIFIGESSDWQDAVITRILYLGIGLSLIIVAYYFCFRKPKSNVSNS